MDRMFRAIADFFKFFYSPGFYITLFSILYLYYLLLILINVINTKTLMINI